MSSFAVENGLIVLNNGSFSYTIQANPSANRVYTLPDSTDTGVSITSTQTLTNKTLTDPTNTIRATQLATTSGDVVLSSAIPPVSGQVLTALSATSAIWLTPNPAGTTYFTFASDNASTSSTSTTYTNKCTFTTVTLPAGNYFVGYSCEVSQTSTNNACQVQFIVNGVTVNDAVFYPRNSADWQSQSGIEVLTLSGAITGLLRFRRATGGGTASCRNARIYLQKV